MGTFAWADRIRRAESLRETYPFARDVLTFAAGVLRFQERLYTRLESKLGREVFAVPPSMRPFLSERWRILVWEEAERPLGAGLLDLHLPALLPDFPEFLDFLRRTGPTTLAEFADFLGSEPSLSGVEQVLRAYWRHEPLPVEVAGAEGADAEALLAFVAKLFLQPYAEFLADRYPDKEWLDEAVAEGPDGGRCPLCHGRPQLSVLRPEAHGRKRSLMCSLCGVEWRFKRICCPACGEEDFRRLASYRSGDFPHVRVEACFRCRSYLKEVDLSVDGRAVPLIDEIAALPLDLWAAQEGYRKIELNLVGG